MRALRKVIENDFLRESFGAIDLFKLINLISDVDIVGDLFFVGYNSCIELKKTHKFFLTFFDDLN